MHADQPDLFYQLCLALVPQVGDVQARVLLQHFGDAASIFRAKPSKLESIEGIGSVRAHAIKSFSDHHLAEAEMAFLQRQDIKPLFLTDKNYPRRLLQCADPPILLFYKGDADLNASKLIAVVGTRSPTDYGKGVTEKFISELEGTGVTIISGLAFGIDALAHRMALRHDLPTVGVVGHGLDRMYPFQHTALAKEMLENGGGLLSEFFSGTGPDRHHFPLRNRVVAGISDATVVIETAIKGGSIITAKLADDYNRDVFALPGRITDRLSQGCNYLIQNNKAVLLQSASDLLKVMGWDEREPQRQSQRSLFVQLNAEEQIIVDLLNGKGLIQLDELHHSSGLSGSSFAASLLNLELQGLVVSLPGKLYKLL